jgi:hypothetical protein
MAALNATHPTLLDLKARMDDNGSIAPIIEILDQNNDVLDDMVWIEGNQTTGHKTTMRSGIPDLPQALRWRSAHQVPHPADHRQLRHAGKLR